MARPTMLPDRPRGPSDETTQRVVREYYADRAEPKGDFRALRTENLRRAKASKHSAPARVT